MAYVFSTNNAPSTHYEAVYQLKAALLAAGWTVLSSGTGSSGAGSGVFGAGDLLTTLALASNPNCWFVMQSPAGAGGPSFGWQNRGSAQTWSIAFDPISGWGAAASPTDLPVSATREWIMGDATFSANWFVQGNATYSWNICADNAAPYPFWVGSIQFGGGVSYGGMMFEAVQGAPAGDSRPYIVTIYGNNNQFGDGLGAPAGRGPFAGNCIIAYDPALVSGISELTPGFYWQNGYGQTLQDQSPMNPITGKDELYPVLYARIATAGGAWQGYKGLGVMALRAGTVRAIGDTYSVAGVRDRIRLSATLSLPWDGSVPVF
jgi:hypothetical protein